MSREFVYPDYELRVGQHRYQDGVALTYLSSKSKIYDYVQIDFTQKLHDLIPPTIKEPVELRWGYNGLQKVFSGFVERIGQSGASVIAKDYMLIFQEHKMKEVLLNADQEEYLLAVLKQSGVQEYEISTKTKHRYPLVNLNNISADQALINANALYRSNEVFFFDKNHKFFFGTPKPQTKAYNFHYGENILNLSKREGTFEMQIVPDYVECTNKITVYHPQCSGTYEVDEIKFMINYRGFPRMWVYFKE